MPLVLAHFTGTSKGKALDLRDTSNFSDPLSNAGVESLIFTLQAFSGPDRLTKRCMLNMAY